MGLHILSSDSTVDRFKAFSLTNWSCDVNELLFFNLKKKSKKKYSKHEMFIVFPLISFYFQRFFYRQAIVNQHEREDKKSNLF